VSFTEVVLINANWIGVLDREVVEVINSRLVWLGCAERGKDGMH
jgi:hypothetical protein